MADDAAANDRALSLLFEYGVNHIDVAAAYGNAERAVGRWMLEHRSRFFLASKTIERSYQGARDEIRRSLERLQCDSLDLIQFHNLCQEADHEEAFSEQGCLRAAIEAREEGLLRFIGVTGHGTRAPAMHLRSLERFPFDSILFPYNFPLLAQAEYARDVEVLLALCAERGVAVQTIKAVAQRRWGQREEPGRRCWYAPIEDSRAFDHALRFVLGHGDLFLNTSSDLVILERSLSAAAALGEECDAPRAADMREVLGRLDTQPLFVPGLDDVGRVPG